VIGVIDDRKAFDLTVLNKDFIHSGPQLLEFSADMQRQTDTLSRPPPIVGGNKCDSICSSDRRLFTVLHVDMSQKSDLFIMPPPLG